MRLPETPFFTDPSTTDRDVVLGMKYQTQSRKKGRGKITLLNPKSKHDHKNKAHRFYIENKNSQNPRTRIYLCSKFYHNLF